MDSSGLFICVRSVSEKKGWISFAFRDDDARWNMANDSRFGRRRYKTKLDKCLRQKYSNATKMSKPLLVIYYSWSKQSSCEDASLLWEDVVITPHGVIFQKTCSFISTVLRTSDYPYCGRLLCSYPNITYLLIPWCRVLLGKLTGLQLVKEFPAFHGTGRFITALTSVRHLFLSWASPIQSIYPHPTSWRSTLILSTHLCLGLPSGLFPSGFPSKTL